jgi:putative membrane protein
VTTPARRVAAPWRWPGAASLLALGYGAYLLHAWATGTLYFYIHPIYVAPAAASGVLLLALGLAGGRARGRVSRPGAALLALPLVLGVLLPPKPLGIAAASQRGISGGSLPAVGGGAAARFSDDDEFRLEVDPSAYSIKDWLKAFAADPEPTAHAGKPVKVTGLVYHDPGLPPGHFMVARFVVQCCAVDAQPVGLPVRAAEAASLEPGAWVEVEGEMAVGEVGGRRRAVVAATAVRPTSRPAQPYLY